MARDDLTPAQQWHRLSPPQRGAVIALAAIEVVLTTITLVDLARRPSREVRGPKALWVVASVVQPFGPIAYLTLGRRSNRRRS